MWFIFIGEYPRKIFRKIDLRCKTQRLEEFDERSIKPVLRLTQSRREMASPARSVCGKEWGPYGRLRGGRFVCLTMSA